MIFFDREECNKMYIGTTKRTSVKKVGEHKQDITKNKQTTALAQHCAELQHVPDFDNIKILDREKTEHTIYIRELTYTTETNEDNKYERGQ